MGRQFWSSFSPKWSSESSREIVQIDMMLTSFDMFTNSVDGQDLLKQSRSNICQCDDSDSYVCDFEILETKTFSSTGNDRYLRSGELWRKSVDTIMIWIQVSHSPIYLEPIESPLLFFDTSKLSAYSANLVELSSTTSRSECHDVYFEELEVDEWARVSWIVHRRKVVS